MILTLTLVLIFSNIIFIIGLLGLLFLIKSSFFLIVSIETMLVAVNINFLFHSIFLNNIGGVLLTFYIIVVSASEMVLLLSFFIIYFKRINCLDINENVFKIKQ